jgi:hypothetical protein
MKSHRKCTMITLIFIADPMNSYTMDSPEFKISASDWIAIPLSRLIGTSELIIYGKIDKVLDSTIIFQILQEVKGKQDVKGKKTGSRLEILKAKPDPFAGIKPAGYQQGQFYMLFLEPGKTSPQKVWRIVGISEEAQMPVVNNYIYFYDRFLKGLPLHSYNVYGVESSIQRFEFSKFLDAVEEYIKYYRWVNRGPGNKYLIEKNCTAFQDTAYRKKSFMHNYLAEETQLMMENN